MVAVLEVYLHSSELEVDSLQSSCQVVIGVERSQSAKAAPSAVGVKRTQIKKTVTQYSCFIGLWLVGNWQRPATPEALLIFPSPS